ncbi:RNA-binding domain-containing protein [Punctularia strigosozonata HHB-11173 SS5]|uniref:RNA-binding domain-containing protein n=1 Tax=Punctularia strigosozonata (strain HHB-11173) TaxID=741275 RepID=UPI0004416B4E|nr:RNA-binding domain-containing protein [Punctularia strigosozonata HHB-11173 SS5]EIN10918.1 RNA-binding domain-containing protein [Punctularia strigosozonata HHB-11173 SS5]
MAQPNTTLYVNNLNDKVNKEELRAQLYALFTTYGKVIDVIASKTPKMRGQAFLVFSELAGATSALRACEGMVFYDKPLRIQYAKTKSYATLKKEDPNFVPPNPAHAPQGVFSASEKRGREDDSENIRPVKKEKQDDGSDDEEMEIEDDDDAPPKQQHQQQSEVQPSARLMASNLPQEVTEDMLSVLFQQYQGFLSVQVSPTATPDATGQAIKMAYVVFESPQLAMVAKDALHGFNLKKNWPMTVVYI